VLVLLACNQHATPFKHVDELADGDIGHVICVRGTVEGPIDVARGAEPLTAFTLAHDSKRVRVLATGELPSRFREAATVDVIGQWLDLPSSRTLYASHHLDGSGQVFNANNVSVQ